MVGPALRLQSGEFVVQVAEAWKLSLQVKIRGIAVLDLENLAIDILGTCANEVPLKFHDSKRATVTTQYRDLTLPTPSHYQRTVRRENELNLRELLAQQVNDLALPGGMQVGVDFIVNSVPTSRMGVAGVFAGDVVAAHRAGVAFAREVFATTTPVGVDAAVLSLYPKDTEFLQHITALAPWKTANEPIVREGGTIVIAIAGTEGLGTHHLFGPGMPLAATRATRVRDRNVVLWCPNVELGELDPDVAGATTLVRSWPEASAWLEAEHGPEGSAAVFPCATIQLGR